ncbi:MAG: hybrid sensor histidine kinase/response regulator [Deltaproteobacteria bacterium]|nr:hybrid sensor histidine kinase/response regulator [Deltaproteobacteria bacterium]
MNHLSIVSPRTEAILLADEDKDVALSLSLALQHRFVCHTSSNVLEGLELLAKHPEIAVMVVSNKVSGMTGIQFCSLVRERYPDVARFLLTSNPAYEDAVAAIHEGQVLGYFVKPVKTDLLLREIEAAIQKVLWQREVTQWSEERERLITELKRINEELEGTMSKLFHADRLATVGVLASSLAHEINNALGLILHEVELPEEEWRKKEIRKQVVDNVKQQIWKLSRMVEGTVNYARKPEIKREKVALAYLVDLTSERLKPILGKGITIDASKVDYDLPLLEVDSSAIEQLLVNLLINARDAMNGWGLILFTAKQEKDQIQLTIEDEGPGVSEEQREKIFEPFFTTKALGRGTGLGLAICRQVMLQHGGVITVEKGESKGARFVMSFPLSLVKS